MGSADFLPWDVRTNLLTGTSRFYDICNVHKKAGLRVGVCFCTCAIRAFAQRYPGIRDLISEVALLFESDQHP